MADYHPPKGSKKNHSGRSRSNPYSSRGLDKFSSVLTELRAKEEEITARTSSQANAMVRFTYSTSKDWIPLIVRRRDDNDQGSRAKELRPPPQAKEAAGKAQAKKAERQRKLSYPMLGVIMLILLCIVMSGRMLAICCTSVWWYLVPKLKSETLQPDCYSISHAYFLIGSILDHHLLTTLITNLQLNPLVIVMNYNKG